MATTTVASARAALAFTRPSRHDGPEHIVRVGSTTLRPLSCCCEAGRRGKLCWAVVSVAASDLEPLARKRWAEAKGVDEITAAARVVGQCRKWAAAARELESLRSIPYSVTASGHAAIEDRQARADHYVALARQAQLERDKPA